ncbi:ATP synthase E subunit [Alkalibacter saccharofermentans DSM 14828]|uniref:ATP synthase E subunit n=1 Tax=Alkalibacter saccharofermentans DSM 14828 TaxID=1120975 RepID=A0A1M4XA57_9FIRM|nr:ATP synthase E subunit [Alkalibacter saccharofermentans DSM 14828]
MTGGEPVITVEDKIRTFSKYVYEKELNEAENLIKEAELKSEKNIKESELKAKEKCEIRNVKLKKKHELERQKVVSKAKITARDKVFKLKNRLLEDLEDSIESSLEGFAESEAYEKWLFKMIDIYKEFILNQDAVIYIKEKDRIEFAEKLMKSYPRIRVAAGDDRCIGGFIIESENNMERIDYTLRSRLEEYQNETGLIFNEMLEEDFKNDR